MVHNRKGQFRPAHFAPCRFDPCECLWGSAFVDEMSIDVNQGGLARFFPNYVVVPNLFVKCSSSHSVFAFRRIVTTWLPTRQLPARCSYAKSRRSSRANRSARPSLRAIQLLLGKNGSLWSTEAIARSSGAGRCPL